MKNSQTGFQTVDEYIARFPEETQNVLMQLRSTIKNAVPKAREKISYQIGAFELDGKNLIYFAGWKKHVSLYPVPAGDEAFNKEIEPYIEGKGTLKFSLDRPLPLELIKRVVKLRAANLKSTEMKPINYKSRR
jgi:uncharacterized protein YdhG (YjbR/CyaY superfamily)